MRPSGYAPVPDALPLTRRSVAWKVLAEPVAFLGGGRAVLLQVAHPKVGAGVEQHSTYASDPWARLFRTVDVMAKLTFASPAVSDEQARILEAMHQRVTGTTEDGAPYAALDPALLVWVWATLVETGLLMYEQVFPPLTAAERAQYYEEWKLVAYGCGVPRGGCPASWADFESYVARVVAEDLRVTRAARSVAHATMEPPLPWPLNRLSAGPQQLVTIGTFPPRLRDGFELRLGRRRRAAAAMVHGHDALGDATHAEVRAPGRLPLRRPAREAAAVPLAPASRCCPHRPAHVDLRRRGMIRV